ncbi:MAG: class I SAM-dependent methyltransferase [Spirochaetes bacterium]|nr:class I SAM-dependent methyltransferase [Spirochaetota bacterium]
MRIISYELVPLAIYRLFSVDFFFLLVIIEDVNIAKSYANQPLHAEIGGIIKSHSENKTDIRSIVIHIIDWNQVHRVIDLGCGYGWFEEAVLSSGKSFDLIVGIDYLKENGPAFMNYAKKIAKEAVFKASALPAAIDFPAGYFDLVICAYSLYFFPGILPEVKRILHNDSSFIIITHSDSMLEEGKKFFDFKNLRTIIDNFSAENGETILRKYFTSIRSIDYNNSLIFHKNDEEDLGRYIDFKREFIKKDADPDIVRETMLRELLNNGEFRLNKNDRIFMVKK